jgi:hypothetical protein
MKTKVSKTGATTTKKAAKTVAVAADPFAEMVDTPAPKKAVAKSEPGAAEPVLTRKKTTRVVKKVAPADAFAETVSTGSPVKKSTTKKTVKAVKADAVAVVDVPKTPVKKTVKKAVKAKKADLDVTAELAAAEPEVELSPVFKALAEVTLPELERENRARLLMQSPTKLYFYWSVRENPWHQLRAIFGDDLGSYTLVLKLTDRKRNSEEIHPCDAEGNWWFEVEPDGEYQAEIGFYATNRPYFRVIYSNTIQTPRRSPSPRPASEAQWTVSANKFAEVLDVAGFSRDAFDVAMAGDDHAGAQDATHTAFWRFIDRSDYALDGISVEDIRYAMLALASGFTLEELRFRVGPALFAILQANVEKLAADKAMSALSEYFDIDEAEWTEEEFGSAVYGASLVHFPSTLKTRKVSSAFSPRYNPVSSHSLR